ncbi:WecB/TagA/CpsF family glycosyltransferase [Sphingomonas sp. ID0503]|uniref:WecB/TagA/CpsF family glycosyltransferase n=1 Tax=Sphingomonas sp. ID0503 TaxID=3399691 RepID=UPI003AFB0919
MRISRAELASLMIEDVAKARAGELAAPKVVIASNGAVIAAYHRDRSFRALVDSTDIIDPDGQSLVFATRLFWREPLTERVATTDFIIDAAAAAEREGVRFYFLGAKPGIAARAAERLQSQFPALQIVGVEHGYFDPKDMDALCARIRASGADVLWLGLGSPLQEAFALAHKEQLRGLAWIRTCGGMFDHQAGTIPRAPMWMQKAGLEWLFRALHEPGRLGWRYTSTNPSAVYHLLTKTRD